MQPIVLVPTSEIPTGRRFDHAPQPHQHRAAAEAGLSRRRFLEESHGPSVPTVSGNANSGPIEPQRGRAYRPSMSRLPTILPPNPRLQRTRAAVSLQSAPGKKASSVGSMRAPLSLKPLGRAMAIATVT
jgi:hypothetical protein